MQYNSCHKFSMTSTNSTKLIPPKLFRTRKVEPQPITAVQLSNDQLVSVQCCQLLTLRHSDNSSLCHSSTFLAFTPKRLSKSSQKAVFIYTRFIHKIRKSSTLFFHKLSHKTSHSRSSAFESCKPRFSAMSTAISIIVSSSCTTFGLAASLVTDYTVYTET